jgi:hypothetical protein
MICTEGNYRYTKPPCLGKIKPGGPLDEPPAPDGRRTAVPLERGVALNDGEVKDLIHALSQGSPLRSQLQKAANEAAATAMRLNEVDRGAAA